MSIVGGRQNVSTVYFDDTKSQLDPNKVKIAVQEAIDALDLKQDLDDLSVFRREDVEAVIDSLTPTPADGWYLVEGASAPLDAENNNLVLIESGTISDRYTPKLGDTIKIGAARKDFDGSEWRSFTGGSPFWVDPVIAKVDVLPAIATVTDGDRFLLSSNPPVIKVVEGGAYIDEIFPDNATVKDGLGNTWQRQGSTLLRLIAIVIKDRPPTPCDNQYQLGQEWDSNGELWKAIATTPLGTTPGSVGIPGTSGTNDSVVLTSQKWQSFTAPETGGMDFFIGGNNSQSVRAIFRLYDGEGIGGELLFEETAYFDSGFNPRLNLSCKYGLEKGRQYTWSLQKAFSFDSNFVIVYTSDYLPGETSSRTGSDYRFRIEVAPTDGVTWLKLKMDAVDLTRPYTQRLSGLLPKIKPGDATKFIVEAGWGMIADSRTSPSKPEYQIFRLVETEYDIPTELDGTETSVYASLENVGGSLALKIQPNAFVADELIDRITLGAILSSNGTTIDNISLISLPDEPEAKSLLDYGAINVTQSFPQPKVNTNQLSFPASTFKFAGRNGFADPKRPHTLSYVAEATLNHVQVQPSGATIGSFDQFVFGQYFNLATNQLVPVSDPSYWTMLFLYRFPSGAFATVIGTEEYETRELVFGQWRSLETARVPENFKNASKFIAAIAGVGTPTDISDRNQALIIPNFEE